jgi:hypothetical protein
MSVTAVATCNFLGTDVRSDGITPTVSIPFNEAQTFDFSNGTAALQANIAYPFPRTFSGTTDVLNLTAGLTDLWTTAVDAVRMKGIFVVNTGTSGIVLGAGTDPVSTWLNATGTITLPPGAWVGSATPDATGWVITPTTACNITVTGTSGQTYTIVLFLANA